MADHRSRRWGIVRSQPGGRHLVVRQGARPAEGGEAGEAAVEVHRAVVDQGATATSLSTGWSGGLAHRLGSES